MRRWSRLQREFYKILADGLDFQIQCRLYRMDSQHGSADKPRYWITLGKEIVWDYPKDFIEHRHPERTNPEWYPYATDVQAISNLIREYIDTSKDVLRSKQFNNDQWGLINILRAADRRIRARRLEELQRKTHNRVARKIISVRLASRQNEGEEKYRDPEE